METKHKWNEQVETIYKLKDQLNDIKSSHIGFEILRDHIHDFFHQVLRSNISKITDKQLLTLKQLIEAIQNKNKMPKELLQLINALDFIILDQDFFKFKLLSYNQVRTICSFFWDYQTQLYPHVDFVLLNKIDQGLSVNLKTELNDPQFWDFYASLDSKYIPIIDLYRIIQKLSMYCQQEQNDSLDLLKMFQEFYKIIKVSKSMYLKQNPHMISREIFELNLQEIINKNKEVQLKVITIDKKNLKNNLEQNNIEFLPFEVDENFEINELTKIQVQNNSYTIISSDYHIKYLLLPDQFLHLCPRTRLSIGPSQMVVLENLSFQDTYYHPQIINTPSLRKLISPNKVIQASMIPKLKVLFFTGINKGDKFLLEPSLENNGKSDFYIGPANCDITIPNHDVKAVISFKQEHGWILQVTNQNKHIYWYLRNQGMPKNETIQYQIMKGTYQTGEDEPKKLKTDRKKGVPFKMMFRHHKDPSYYDPKANDKIFVPDMSGADMTEEQKAIIGTFPEKDRGIFKEGEVPIEKDPLEAVVKKMKIKRRQKRLEEQNRKVKQQTDGNVLQHGDSEDDDLVDDSDEEFVGSQEDDDEDYYDEEDDEEEEVKDETTKEYDANTASKKVQMLKPADGVKFVQYDEYGLPKNDGFNYSQFIVTDEMQPTDMYIPAPPEMVERMLYRTGINKDYDKEVNQMTEEEKAVFNCLEDEVGEYEELEDDFLMMANEGQPALITVEVTQTEGEAEFANKGVVIVRDEEEEKLKAMREKYKKTLNIGQTDDGQEEDLEGVEEEEMDVDEDDNKQENFDKVLYEDYADDQIGDAEGEFEQQDQITKEEMDDALNEFIESQKFRDKTLYRQFKDQIGGYQQEEATDKPQFKTKQEVDLEDVETEQDKEDIIKKSLALNEVLTNEMEERGLDYDSSEEEEDNDAKWDCQSILSTFTNTDNHPGVIKTTRKVKPGKANRIELHKQLKVPLDGLVAEVIDRPDLAKEKKKKNLKAYEVVAEEIESDSESSKEEGELSADKKQKKKEQKQEKRDKRKLKKELKLAFKSQNTKLVKQTTAELGQLRQGVSVKKIY